MSENKLIEFTATDLSITFLKEDWKGFGFQNHALNPIANAMRKGLTDIEIEEMLIETLPKSLKRDYKFMDLINNRLESVDFEKVVESLRPDIEYLSHLRDKKE